MSLPELLRQIAVAFENTSLNPEVIFIDDGSTDNSWEVIRQLNRQYSFVKGIKFQRNYGKAAALNTGFDHARGEVVVTMDADLQDNPEEIPEMVRMITEGGYDLVSGWKKVRYDPLSKTIPTKLYNWATRKMSGIKLHDFNCGLKAYRSEVIKSVEVYGDMHRYIPVLAKREGFGKIGEKIVQHRPREFGVTKFGLERFINGPLDLMTVSFVSRFGKRPMHFFGTIGGLVFLVGLAMFIWIGSYKIWALVHDIPAKNIAQMSVFYIALVAMIIGTQLFVGGFLAELVQRASPDRNNYKIQRTVGLADHT